MQDHKGNMWFSTEAGLCRFNGKRVRIYNKHGGIPENATYTLFEDKKGILWATTSRNRILFFNAEKDTFLEAPFNKACDRFFKTRLQEIYKQDHTVDSLLYLSAQYVTVKVNLLSNKVSMVDSNRSTTLFFLLNPDACIPVRVPISQDQRELIATKKKFLLAVQKGSKTVQIPIVFKQSHYVPQGRLLGVVNKKNEYFIAFDHTIVKIAPDLSWEVHTVDANILALYCDHDDGVWIGTYKNGLFYYPDGFNKAILSLPDLSVTSICEDAEHGVWCTTLEKGVLYARNKYVITYSNIPGLNKRAEFIKIMGNKLFTSSDKNELFILSSPTVVGPPIKLPASAGITDLYRYKNYWLIASKGPLVRTDTNFAHEKVITLEGSAVRSTTVKQFAGSGKRIFGLHRGTLVELINDHYAHRIYILPSPGNCIAASAEQGLLLGCKDGLYRVDTSTFQLAKIPGISGSVTQLFESGNHTLWSVVREQGLFALTDKGVKKLAELPGLGGARYSGITEDTSGTLWIASNLGLIRLRDPFGKPKVQVYTSMHGLNSTEQLLVAVRKDHVFISSYEGLCSFPINADLVNETAPPIYIENLLVNGKERSLTGQSQLASNENNLVVSLSIPIYKQGTQPIKFFYSLDGGESFHNQEGTTLTLDNLAPGHYRILFFAMNSDGKRSATPAVLDLTISKPFWQKPLFLVGLLLILISLIYFIVTNIVKRIRKKEAEKTRVNKLLAEYQMSALRAQMNPHFIFNCINSIQKFVLSNNSAEAYDYLAKFSMLIRLVLNYAEDNLISLEQELEIIDLYCELEQLRFDEKFTYEIKIHERVDRQEAMVPVMLMQPYIENAIWHGLMHLDESVRGHIKMDIDMAGSALRIVIEDNGVGLERSAALRKKGHQSKATDINNRRTKILNIIGSQTSGSISMDDIIGQNGEIQGTRVVLIVPQNTYDDE